MHNSHGLHLLEYCAPYSTGGMKVVYSWDKPTHFVPWVGMSFSLTKPRMVRVKVTKIVYDEKRHVYKAYLNHTIHRPKSQPHRKPISNREKRIFDITSSLFTKSKQLTDKYIANALRPVIDGLGDETMSEILNATDAAFFEAVGATKLMASVTDTTFAESITSAPDIILHDPTGIAHPR